MAFMSKDETGSAITSIVNALIFRHFHGDMCASARFDGRAMPASLAPRLSFDECRNCAPARELVAKVKEIFVATTQSGMEPGKRDLAVKAIIRAFEDEPQSNEEANAAFEFIRDHGRLEGIAAFHAKMVADFAEEVKNTIALERRTADLEQENANLRFQIDQLSDANRHAAEARNHYRDLLRKTENERELRATLPVAMILHCPICLARHVDKGEFATKPHHTHACQYCGHVWRPAIENTVGVRFLPGFRDSEPANGAGIPHAAATRGNDRKEIGARDMAE